MKNLVIESNNENILKTLEKDILDRNDDLMHFVELLDSFEDATTIAIDANWGEGKTFFVKQAQLILNSFNEYMKKNEFINSNRNQIKSIVANKFGKKFELQNQVAVYYDAWENDSNEEPILSLCYTILKDLKLDYEFKENEPDFCGLIVSMAELITKVPKLGHIENMIAALQQTRDPLDELRKSEKLDAKIKDFFDSILPEIGDRLVVFVDELDRCKPTYAVKLLERIKHYFENERITFVFSVNIKQLQNTIKTFYGQGFDASRYLDRFFDLRISLPKPNLNKYLIEISRENKNKQRIALLNSVCQNIGIERNLSLREFAKFYRHISIATGEFYKIHINNNYYSDGERAENFCKTYIVPFLIALKLTNQDKYTEFMEGRLCAKDGSLNPLKDYLAPLCDYNMNIYWSNKDKDGILGDLKEVYYELFISKNANNSVRRIGNMEFNNDLKQKIIRIANILSKDKELEIETNDKN